MKRALLFLVSIFSLGLQAQKKWTLRECIEYAYDHNLQITQNEFAKKNQEQNARIAQRNYLPSVSANMSNSVSFGQALLGTGSIRNDRFSNSANVGADVLLYNNGRLEKNSRKIQYDVEASQYDIEAAKNDISLQIAQQYLNILLNKEIQKIAESALENTQKQYNKAKITTEVGTTPETVLAEANAALMREKQNVNTAKINVKRNLFTLSLLLQLENSKDFEVEDVLISDMPSPEDFSLQNVVDLALQSQPQIKAAEKRLLAAEAQTEITRTAFWPTLSANVGIGTFYINLLNTNNVGSELFYVKEKSFISQYKDNFGQQLAVSLSVPIFNKGITKIQVEQAKINEDMMKNSLAIQKQNVLQNVQKAQFDVEANNEILLAAKESEKSAKIALEFSEKSYNAGRSTIYDVNIARNNYANAQGSVAQAKYNYTFSLQLLNFYKGLPIYQ